MFPVLRTLGSLKRCIDMRTFVIYTTETGGTYQIVRATREQYDEAVKSGVWDVTPYDWDTKTRTLVPIKMIGFLECREYHDFVLDKTFDPNEE